MMVKVVRVDVFLVDPRYIQAEIMRSELIAFVLFDRETTNVNAELIIVNFIVGLNIRKCAIVVAWKLIIFSDALKHERIF